MVFSSGVFLFLFLPLVLVLYYNPIVRGIRFRNVLLVVASVLFYAYGEPVYVLVMLASIVVNWLFGLALSGGKHGTAITVLAVFFNLGLLFVFKYLDFTITNLNTLFHLDLPLRNIALPIGISFFTFQALSYVIDVKRNPKLAQKNLLDVGLYISFFPQLIAGPIVRYETIAGEIRGRKETWKEFTEGFRRFLWGLSKKVIIANQIAVVADAAHGSDSLTMGLAWLGAIAYTLQIYFDFSGYSDMAIGLGRMFGFHFPENFRYPYISTSVTEFWRRWHISLSAWFRDYLYIPLGGNRVGPLRHILNLAIVWFCTGFWHGASWNFILWGGVYFVFLVLEKYTGFAKKIPHLAGWFYTMLVVCLCWVLFRAETLTAALSYFKAMFGGGPGGLWDAYTTILLTNNWSYYLLGLLALPLYPWLRSLPLSKKSGFQLVGAVFQIGVFLLTIGFILSSSYDPFIYFNF